MLLTQGRLFSFLLIHKLTAHASERPAGATLPRPWARRTLVSQLHVQPGTPPW